MTNAYLLLNGASDLSDHMSAVELDVEAEELDSTTFGSTGYKSMLGGLKSGSLKCTFKGDYAASNIDSILWPLLGTVVAFDVKAVNAARSTSNPSYTGSVLISNVNPIAGGVGDLVEFDLTWPTTGTITRATA
jgi:hypothetical protein